MPGKNDATMAYVAASMLPDAGSAYMTINFPLLYLTPLI